MRACVEATASLVCCIDFRRQINPIRHSPYTGPAFRSWRFSGNRVATGCRGSLGMRSPDWHAFNHPIPVYPTRRHIRAHGRSANVSGSHGNASGNGIERSSPGARRRQRNRSRKSYENTNRRFQHWSTSNSSSTAWVILTGGSLCSKARSTMPPTG